MRIRGFTLLEVLLVIGVAAILIVSGIMIYNLAVRTQKVNETIKLLHHIVDDVHSIYATIPDYGNGNMESVIYNMGTIPAQYKSATLGELTTPFGAEASAISIVGSGVFSPPNDFVITMSIPPAYVPRIMTSFYKEINSKAFNRVEGCGQGFGAYTSTLKFDVKTLVVACGSSTEMPSSPNFTIITP